MWGGTDDAESMVAIQTAIESGITLIDTAPAYGFGHAEEIVGRALAGRRDRVVLATKCGLVWHCRKGKLFFNSEEGSITQGEGKYQVHRYLGRDAIRYEVEQSLRRLKVDYIDLYQTHWQDVTTPIDETMDELLRRRPYGGGGLYQGPARTRQETHEGAWPGSVSIQVPLWRCCAPTREGRSF
jgi:aryl-alcohol dehydrogenase-like predicted oxidoreductase